MHLPIKKKRKEFKTLKKDGVIILSIHYWCHVVSEAGCFCPPRSLCLDQAGWSTRPSVSHPPPLLSIPHPWLWALPLVSAAACDGWGAWLRACDQERCALIWCSGWVRGVAARKEKSTAKGMSSFLLMPSCGQWQKYL